MSELSFFHAITFNGLPTTRWNSTLETVDDFFHLWGRKAFVIDPRRNVVVLSEESSSFIRTALKVVLICTLIIPFILVVTKLILRSSYTFTVIDPEIELRKKIEIPNNVIESLQKLLPEIVQKKTDGRLVSSSTTMAKAYKLLPSNDNIIFTLTAIRQLIFKMKWQPSGIDVPTTYNNMAKGKEICLAHRLSKIVIPYANKLEITAQDSKTYTLLAMERFDFDSQENAQKTLYYTRFNQLTETTKELALLIAKTGFSNVSWRHIPLTPDNHVMLHDLSEMKSAQTGFFGHKINRRGLIRCLTSEEQIESALAVAKQHGIKFPNKVKERRLQEIEFDKDLDTFHKAKELTGNELILFANLGSLDLPLQDSGNIANKEEPEWIESVVFEKVVIDLVKKLNECITKAAHNTTIKDKRRIVLNTSEYPLSKYVLLGAPESGLDPSEEDKKQLWLNRILEALKIKGHIFSYSSGDLGYIVQA